MRDPLAWAGGCVFLGAVVWPMWQAGPAELFAGAWFMGALALVGRHWPVARHALAVGAFLVGGAVCASWPPIADLPGNGFVSGEVLSTSGWRALVRTDKGRLVLRFANGAPPTGQRFAAWTGPARPLVLLPGERDPRPSWLRSGARPRRVRRWVALGARPRDGPVARLALARNAGLLRALAVGDRSDVPDAIADLLRRTGTSHLLAISGLHIGLVSGLLWALGRWLARPLALGRWPALGRWLPPLLGLWGAVAYASVVGWPVSTRRAVWMIAAAVLAALLGRRPRAWTLLGVAAGAVVLADPGQATSPGFLLSFGAVVGMLLVAPRILRWLPPDRPRLVVWVVGSLAATIGALAGTLPVAAWLFQSLSPVAPLANLLVTPLLGLVAVPAVLLAVRLPLDPALVSLALADSAVDLALTLLHWVDTQPLHPAVGPLGALGLAAAVVLRKKPLIAFVVATIALVARPAPDAGRLVVTFLAVGQGDAALVEWPDGRRWLVDGGPPGRDLLHYLRREGVRSLDRVWLSHAHPDHAGGLGPVIEALDVAELWVPRAPHSDEQAYGDLWALALDRGITIRSPPARPAAAILLHPLDGWQGSVNDQSLVVRFAFGARRFLFTGDIEHAAEEHLVDGATDLLADVVKVPHHGSHTSSTSAFVAATGARLAVISCGPDNRFGHPRPVALSRWAGIPVWRTDRDGTVEVSTDGHDLRVRAWTPDTGWRSMDRRAWTPTRPSVEGQFVEKSVHKGVDMDPNGG